MKQILFLKLTSLGDLLHALPALTDAKQARPELQFDWVIDDKFQEVASWHTAVRRSFITDHRNWRDSLFHSDTRRAIAGLIKDLRSTSYDLVLDGQGNFKTALLALCTKGTRAGFDGPSVREWIAHLAYQRTYSASWKIHAIERLRRLFAQALDYPFPQTPPDFQLDPSRFSPLPFELPKRYAVFIHSATWQTKLWPEAHWRSLIEMATALDMPIYLPWGSEQERLRAERLAVGSAKVLPKLTLSEIATLLLHAAACVSMDTGLSHLAAALNTPTITLYGSTDSGLIGASGQLHLQSTLPCAPCNKKRCQFAITDLHPPCLAQITPATVFARLEKITRCTSFQSGKSHILYHY